MILGVDLRVLASGRRTGVEQYTIGLLRALAGDNQHQYRFFYNAWKKAPLRFSWLRGQNRRLFEFDYPNKILDLGSLFLRRPQFDQQLGGCDVYFTPHFLRAPLKRAKGLVTFHDLSFEYYPNFFSKRHKLWHYLQNPRQRAQEADLIVAVSQSTKDDLVNLYGVSGKKIKVIYSGLEQNLFGQSSPAEIVAVRRKYKLPPKFILYFGTLEPRKNLGALMTAFALLRQKKKWRDFSLVLAGSRGWLYRDILGQARQSKAAEHIYFPGLIANQDKRSLYQAAAAFVYPSFFEGFGFPPLEAMASGVPVVCSNKTSLPEVVGDAALMVDPFLPGELYRALEMVLGNEQFGRQLIAKGGKRAKMFSWSKTAQQFLRAIDELNNKQ